MKDIMREAQELLRKNRRTTNGHQYTVPSPDSYPYQWLWDSCFHAIILARFEPDAAKRELQSLAARQFENGMLPHMIYWEHPPGEPHRDLDIAWGKDGTSSITQPPLFAYAAWRVYEHDRDTDFLAKLYPALYHYYQYLLRERDPHERHLIGIINPDESGEDDSPRFDEALNLPPTQTLAENFKRRLSLVEENRTCNFDAPFCMKNFFWVKDVPFNTIMIEGLRALSRIATLLDRAYDAEYFESESSRIAAAMRELMFEDGVYWPTRGEQYQKVKVRTWAMFAPLFAKLYEPDEAEQLITRLHDPAEFATPYIVPTVSRAEASYNPDGFWRGPAWIATNWILYHGLMNYGFAEEAARVRDASVSLIEREGFREHFNPETGEGQGAKEFTWGALVLDMM